MAPFICTTMEKMELWYWWNAQKPFFNDKKRKPSKKRIYKSWRRGKWEGGRRKVNKIKKKKFNWILIFTLIDFRPQFSNVVWQRNRGEKSTDSQNPQVRRARIIRQECAIGMPFPDDLTQVILKQHSANTALGQLHVTPVNKYNKVACSRQAGQGGLGSRLAVLKAT